jgi:hypothetical protein
VIIPCRGANEHRRADRLTHFDEGREMAVPPDPVLCLSTMIIVRDAVSAGAGAALLPHFFVAEEFTPGRHLDGDVRRSDHDRRRCLAGETRLSSSKPIPDPVIELGSQGFFFGAGWLKAASTSSSLMRFVGSPRSPRFCSSVPSPIIPLLDE